jgi:hypothetical protein
MAGPHFRTVPTSDFSLKAWLAPKHSDNTYQGLCQVRRDDRVDASIKPSLAGVGVAALAIRRRRVK